MFLNQTRGEKMRHMRHEDMTADTVTLKVAIRLDLELELEQQEPMERLADFDFGRANKHRRKSLRLV